MSEHIGATKGDFSVCQFFTTKGVKAFDEQEDYEYVRRWVSAEEATKVFEHYCTSVAAKMGFVKRVIITDGGDYTNAEWKFGEGLVYPLKEEK